MERLTYFISQIELGNDSYEGCHQFYALFHNKKKAQRFVMNNATDLWETIFEYACIEGVSDSVCPCLGDGIEYRQFYKYNRILNKYEQCEAPTEYYKNLYTMVAQ